MTSLALNNWALVQWASCAAWHWGSGPHSEGEKARLVCRHVERSNSAVQGSKLTVASSKFATWKFSLLPGQTVGSKKVLPGIVPRTLSTLCCECLQCKLGLTFHMNHLPSRQFTCNVKPHFCWNKKKILWKCCLLNMLSAWRFNL